ncbi:hypothetical protein CEE44_04705 [Candidatus Woesearchaeota archaeon B3_Woes]|nr:MAG: hypothetical protein CEE44_04705 [Candidatus Woesearchaeota archaeon B3_Woes]
MVEQNKIEFVCTANHGRSPVAALIASNYLKQIGADEYNAISSGSHVDAINRGEVSTDFMLHVIGIAQDRGMYSYDENELLSDVIADVDKGALDTLKGFYERASGIFVREEHQYRSEILPLLGIKGEIKQTQDQTIARPDTLGVYPMADSNHQAVDRIYGESEYRPKVIEPLGISNAFGLSKEAYQGSIEEIVVKVPQKINELLGV